MNHGSAIAIQDYWIDPNYYRSTEPQIRLGEMGIITGYLPDQNAFAVDFGNGKWLEFDMSEKSFLEYFDVSLQPSLVRRREKWFIGYDQSSHQYLVPLKYGKEWVEWVNLPEDDERSWEAPDYAIDFEGELLTFENPELNHESPFKN